MAFSATDAAFEGFRLARERPAAVGVWALLQLVINVGGQFLMVSLAGPAFQKMQDLMSDPAALSDPAAADSISMALLPAEACLLLLLLAVAPVLTAAIYRCVLRPQDRGLVSLKFGPDEVRQLVVTLVVGIITCGVLLAGSIASSLLVGLLALGGPALGALGGVVGLSATVVVIAWVLLRLSLAGPLSFDAGRLAITQSWHLTRGRVMNLLSAYLLAALMAAIVNFCCLLIFMCVAGVISGGIEPVFKAINTPGVSVESFFTPLRTAYVVYASLISGLTTAILVGANARAYLQVKGTPLVV